MLESDQEDWDVSNIGIAAWWEERGITVPEAYRKGLGHNNCSGGCVRAGLRHWARLLQIRPEVYKAREHMEERFNAEVVPLMRNPKPVAILRRGGKPLPLRALREHIEAGLEPSYPRPTYADYADVPCECGE